MPEKFRYLIEHEILAKTILIKKEVIVRVYIITLEKLANRDEGLFEGGAQGISDPYVKIYLNNDDKENTPLGADGDHVDDQKDVLWCKHYEYFIIDLLLIDCFIKVLNLSIYWFYYIVCPGANSIINKNKQI